MRNQIRRLFKGLQLQGSQLGHQHSMRLIPSAIHDAEPKPSNPLASESEQQEQGSQDQGDSQQLQWSKDAKALAQSVSDTLATSGEDGPSNRELLQLLQQQSQLISKYQTRLDVTNATLLQNQRMLQRISTKLEVPSPRASDGYTNIALPETLSDTAIRERSTADSNSSENDWSAGRSSDLNQDPENAPANHRILYTPPDPRVIKYLPHRGTRQAPGGPAWSAADRRALGGFDARFHSTSAGATPRDHRVLPQRIILVRHAQSEGNVNNIAYTSKPDPQIPLTMHGVEQAVAAGNKLLEICEPSGDDHKFFFYTSPYCRSVQTYKAIETVIPRHRHAGVQEEVQLREQDFGNFQDAALKAAEKSERLKYGRFFYRFPNGESGADVYDRITIFEDHMVRDINAGRFSSDVSLVLLTHGLTLRVLLMRWFRWTVDEFLDVFNPPNAVPLRTQIRCSYARQTMKYPRFIGSHVARHEQVLERICAEDMAQGNLSFIHTKCLYRLSDESQRILKGASKEMCRMTESARLSTYPRSPPVRAPSDE